MKEKEIAELRRRLRPEKNNITHIRGCYVNESGEPVSLFDQQVLLMPQEESEAYLAYFKRSLSGMPDKNLIDITFSTAQVAGSDEHGLLMALRDSALKDEAAVQEFYRRVMATSPLKGNYLILLAQDIYDVPVRRGDGEFDRDGSDEVFSYILCSICPVKKAKPALSYYVNINEFHNRDAGWIVSAPELGFLFPAFDDRSTNLYNALYYSRDVKEIHRPFVDAVFHAEVPMPAGIQQETFQEALTDALAEECSLEVVQAVHEQLHQRVELHKADKEMVPLAITRKEVDGVLAACGVSEEHVARFDEKLDAAFGAEATLSPQNMLDSKMFEVKTADVTIRIDPTRSELIETRIINGRKYLLIPAEEGTTVNGVPIHIGAGDENEGE